MTNTEPEPITPSPEQQAIIDSKENTIVVANPGTGKTYTLALKVIDLLENDADPEQILCITYTAKAKKEMFDTIYGFAKGRFPDSDIMKIKIFTFHGFALDYLSENGLISGDILGNNFLRYTILQSFINNKALHYPKNYIISDILGKVENGIRYAKSFGITPDKIDLEKSADIIQQGWKPTKAFSKDDLVQFLNYVVQAYTMYENSKGEEIDYSDMLLLFLEKFQDDKFEYVLVDEMQDMNEIEARIINMISKNLFLVGDAKQAIFGFQGGSIKNFENFSKTCKQLFLSENRRSTQQILDYSKQYFLDGTAHRTKFEAELKNFNGTKLGEFPKVMGTNAPMKTILVLIQANPDKKIGIITRKNRQIIEISRYLDMNNIDYASTSSQATTDEAKNAIITLIKGLLSDDIKAKISATFTLFSPFSLEEAFEFSNALKRDGTLKQSPNIDRLKSWNTTLAREDLEKLFTDVIYPKCVANNFEWFASAVSVKEKIDEYLTYETPTLEGLLDFIDMSEESYVERSKQSLITLTTVHKAKGRAFDIVLYLPSTAPNKTSWIDFIISSILEGAGVVAGVEAEESLRTDFVAFTRAKEKLFIIGKESTVTSFHIQPLSKYHDTGDDADDSVSTTVNNRLAEAYSLFVSGRTDDSQKLLKQQDNWVKERIFSYFQNVERLSYSYIKTDPWKFFISSIVKRPWSSAATDYGGRVHDALQDILKGDAKLEDFSEEEQKSIQNGLTSLEELKNNHPGFTLVGAEVYKKIPMSSITTYNEQDNLLFSGYIDAVFKHDDGILLVDWKTDKNENYAHGHKRQLAVYKKMYSILEGIPEDKIKTCIIFVALRGGVNTGRYEGKIDFGTRDVYGTFEGHLQKVLGWKTDPDDFIKKLVEEPTQDAQNDPLYEIIKEKLLNPKQS